MTTSHSSALADTAAVDAAGLDLAELAEAKLTGADLTAADTGRFAKFYRAAWRWHFYAGLYVIPFFCSLALTGMAMMWLAFFNGVDGERIAVEPMGAPLAVSQQAQTALALYPGSTLEQYVAPATDSLVSLFRVNTPEGTMLVMLNPYTAEVLHSGPRQNSIFDFMETMHGTILLGATGERMVEIAASLAIILIVTGIFMWWPRGKGGQGKGLKAMLKPNFALKKRGLWKNLHSVVGTWVAAVLLLFLLSGLAWSGVWGGKLVQPWSSFPADKSARAHASDPANKTVSHDQSINNGPKEVPWVLEQTPMPVSGLGFGADGIVQGTPLSVDVLDAFARDLGFDARYHLVLPKGDTGVWSLTRSSMSTDSPNPFIDRTVHIDQYSGKVLADIAYADYGIMGKLMAAGIAYHMGTVGLFFILMNTVFCLGILFLCVSGVIMWWQRRPAGQKGLVPPPAPRDMPIWKGAVVIAIFISMAFPMAGLALLSALAIDWLILSPLARRTQARKISAGDAAV